MVKKKTSEQHESKQTDHKEQPDNEATNKDAEAVSPQSDAENEVKDTQAAESPAEDKVIAEEKTPEEKLAEMQDRYLRVSAEFDNYRRRTLREKIDLTKYATENLLINILPLMDDFERALSHIGTGTDCTAVKEGIDLIYGKFVEFLKQNGVREIESLNCPFNVDQHHAVANRQVQEEEKEKKGKVIEVVQKGYYLHDKVIRHAKVVVGE